MKETSLVCPVPVHINRHKFDKDKSKTNTKRDDVGILYDMSEKGLTQKSVHPGNVNLH